MIAPRVSVVMSVYNSARHLRIAVESILRQTFSDFEFIIVNDGSTDQSPAILAEFAAVDKRIRIINQANTGLTIALQVGCRVATGEFIARQDADDWSAPQRLEYLVRLLHACPAAVMASSWAIYIDDDGEIVDRVARPLDPIEATHRLLNERCGPPAHGTMIFRKSAYERVGGYRSCFYYGQDADLWLRLGRIGYIAYEPQELYHWRLSTSGISGTRSDWQAHFGELGQASHALRIRGVSDELVIAAAERLRQLILSSQPRPSSIKRQQSATHYRIGTSLSRIGNASARSHFWSAIRLNPCHWRSWLRLTASFFMRSAANSSPNPTPSETR